MVLCRLVGMSSAVLAAVLLASCSGAPSLTDGVGGAASDVVANALAKPDITNLTSDMFLTEQEFPVEGEYRWLHEVRRVENAPMGRNAADPTADERCPWAGAMSVGQIAVTNDKSGNFTASPATFKLDVAAFDPPQDCRTFWEDNFMGIDVAREQRKIDIPGASDLLVGAYNSRSFGGVGFVRGTMIGIQVSRDGPGEVTKEQVVSIYRKQAEKLAGF
jgi:hypothetical protein